MQKLEQGDCSKIITERLIKALTPVIVVSRKRDNTGEFIYNGEFQMQQN